jgi:hypothetical protein
MFYLGLVCGKSKGFYLLCLIFAVFKTMACQKYFWVVDDIDLLHAK